MVALQNGMNFYGSDPSDSLPLYEYLPSPLNRPIHDDQKAMLKKALPDCKIYFLN